MNSSMKFLVRGIKKLIRDSPITNPKFLLWNLWRHLTKSNIYICDSVVPMITVKPGWHCLLSFCIFFKYCSSSLYEKVTEPRSFFSYTYSSLHSTNLNLKNRIFLREDNIWRGGGIPNLLCWFVYWFPQVFHGVKIACLNSLELGNSPPFWFCPSIVIIPYFGVISNLPLFPDLPRARIEFALETKA